MMSADSSETDLLRRFRAGDQQALDVLFERYRDRLRRMIRLRLDRRLQGRVDPSDVLREAYLDVARRVPEYTAAPPMQFYLWLRVLTGQRLLEIRFGVILRKVWGGSRTWAGAQAQSILMSVWRTCWQQGRSAVDFLSQLLRGPPSQDGALAGLNAWLAGCGGGRAEIT